MCSLVQDVARIEIDLTANLMHTARNRLDDLRGPALERSLAFHWKIEK